MRPEAARLPAPEAAQGDDGRWRLGRRNSGEHVAFQHLAALAAAGDRGKIDLILGGDLGRGWRRRHRSSGGGRNGGGLAAAADRAGRGWSRAAGVAAPAATWPSSAPIATV